MEQGDALEQAQQEIQHLKTALEHRDRIGMAKGMLMMRYALGPEQAFAFLTRRSQAENIKVHDLAATVIAELAADASVPAD